MAKTYDTYKDSGIAWIGNIPSGWSTIKNKYLYSLLYSGGTPTASEGKFYAEEGCPFVAISDMSTTEYVTETKKHLTEDGIANKNLKILPSGTILYSIYATVGVVSELMIDATISQAMLAIELKSKINKSYYKYNLKAMKDYIFSQANGNTQFNLNAEKVSNFVFCFPSLSEQQAIATYLDEKCGEIDSLISLQEEMISELQAYKQSVITEAVTKGLDPNVPMKDSGVEWIGMIPVLWTFSRAGDIANYKKGPFGSAITKSVFVDKSDKTVKVYEQQNAIKKDWRLGYYYITNDYYMNNLTAFEVHAGDIIVSCAGTIGEMYVMPPNIEKGVINQALMRIRLNESLGINKKYFMYLFDVLLKVESSKSSNGSAIKNIPPFNILKKIRFGLPPLSEQQAIASYLDEKTSQIDSLIALKQEKITELKDYKKSIIYEYVTGKKKV